MPNHFTDLRRKPNILFAFEQAANTWECWFRTFDYKVRLVRLSSENELNRTLTQIFWFDCV